MKAVSLIVKILVAVVVIAVLTVGVILVTVDPNDYRDKITQIVKDETGRDLTVQNMSLSIFPSLSVDLEQASLSNAENFSAEHFVTVDKVQVGAAILPLLSQSLEVDTLTLHGFNLNLERKADGSTNWDGLVKAKDDHEVKDEQAKANPLDKLAALNIGGIDIQNGQVHWQDAQQQQDIRLQNLNFSSGAISFGEFFEMALQAETQVAKPQISNKLAVSIEAKLDKDGQYSLRNLKLNNELTGQGIPVEQASIEIHLPKFDLQEQQLSLPELVISYAIKGGKDLPIATADGKLNITDLSGNIEQQAFQVAAIDLQGNVTGDSIPTGKATISLQSSAALDLSKETVTLPKFNANLMDVKVSGKADISQLKSNALADAQISIAETNLHNLLKQLKIELPPMADNKSLTKFALSSKVKFASENQALSLNDLTLNLDNSKLTGNASVSQFKTPNIGFNLALDQINVNNYLPPKADKPKTATKTDENAKIELPVELLRKLTLNGTIKVAKASYDKINASNILLTTKGSKGYIKANPIRADLFKTRLNASASIDVRGKTPKYSFTTNTQNLPIGEVMQAFADSDKLSGNGTLNANITTAGDSIADFKKNLNGKTNVDLKDGAIKGFNLAQAIRNAKAKLSGKPTEPTDANAQTDFSSLVAQATIKNGVITTQKLSALAPYMRVNGSGSVNLPKETLDYLVKTKIVGSDKGQGGKELQELNGLTIPVKLTGAMTSPNISLDLGSILEQKTKQEIEKKKEEAVKGLEQQLKDNLFKGFKF